MKKYPHLSARSFLVLACCLFLVVLSVAIVRSQLVGPTEAVVHNPADFPKAMLTVDQVMATPPAPNYIGYVPGDPVSYEKIYKPWEEAIYKYNRTYPRALYTPSCGSYLQGIFPSGSSSTVAPSRQAYEKAIAAIDKCITDNPTQPISSFEAVVTHTIKLQLESNYPEYASNGYYCGFADYFYAAGKASAKMLKGLLDTEGCKYVLSQKRIEPLPPSQSDNKVLPPNAVETPEGPVNESGVPPIASATKVSSTNPVSLAGSEDSKFMAFLKTLGDMPKAWIDNIRKLWDQGVFGSSQDFPNYGGRRVELAAKVISKFPGGDKAWEDPLVKQALADGLIKKSESGLPEYVPYQDPEYAPIYYYRCGPYDLVNTLEKIEEECAPKYKTLQLEDIPADEPRLLNPGQDPDTVPTKRRVLKIDRSKALLIDIQTGNRKSFAGPVNTYFDLKSLSIKTNDPQRLIPPYIVKYGSYVYASDRVNNLKFLTLPWWPLEFNDKGEPVGAQTDPLRSSNFATDFFDTKEAKHHEYTPSYWNHQTANFVPLASGVAVPFDYGAYPNHLSIYNRYADIDSVDDQESENPLALEWVRYGGDNVRQVFEVLVNDKIDEEPPVIYARDGDVIHFKAAGISDSEIVGQPLNDYSITTAFDWAARFVGYQYPDPEDKKVPAFGFHNLDKWGVTFSPLAVRLYNTTGTRVNYSSATPVPAKNAFQEYDYTVGFTYEPCVLTSPQEFNNYWQGIVKVTPEYVYYYPAKDSYVDDGKGNRVLVRERYVSSVWPPLDDKGKPIPLKIKKAGQLKEEDNIVQERKDYRTSFTDNGKPLTGLEYQQVSESFKTVMCNMPAIRVRYRIISALGATASFFSNPVLLNDNADYGYILREGNRVGLPRKTDPLAKSYSEQESKKS